ncbi:MAG: cysteine desulfurase family protein, partial [Pseudobdellovibrionaceae bacterium]
QVVHVPMLPTGKLDMEFFKSELDHHTALVSIMAANNEFGSIFPLKEICELAHTMGSLVHTDAVQAFGKLPIQLKQWGVDYATFSAHKFYALKGCGFLYVRKGVPFQSLIPGGGQERSRRAGTENILGIASLKAVIPFLPETAKRANQTRFLRDEFESQIKSRISGVQINAVESDRLPNTSSLVIDGIDGETLLMSLDMKGVAVSTGAACSSGNPEPSPSLLALGLTRAQAQRSLRISFGWGNTQHELDHLVETLIETVAYLRSLNPSIHSSYEKTTELHP